jgi:tyrosyl-tRNA synthetase
MLTEEQVNANAETYLNQFFKIVDREKTEVRRQSEWFGEFNLADVVRLAAKVTVAQMLERADFAERFQKQQPIGVHELLYPLLQGYDSVAIKSDTEFGGTDQKFNLLVGRDLQAEAGQKPQSVYTVPLLVGTDGEVKMSKSLGNYIAVEDPPNDMYGKLMSLPDHRVAEYFDYLTDITDDEVEDIRSSIDRRTVNPMEPKKRLAHEVVAQFHSPAAASEAAAFFERTFSKREVPDQVPEKAISFRSAGGEDGQARLPALIVLLGMAQSGAEANRLVKQRAVEIDGEVVADTRVSLRNGMVIRVGKHRFARVLNADA